MVFTSFLAASEWHLYNREERGGKKDCIMPMMMMAGLLDIHDGRSTVRSKAKKSFHIDKKGPTQVTPLRSG